MPSTKTIFHVQCASSEKAKSWKGKLSTRVSRDFNRWDTCVSFLKAVVIFRSGGCGGGGGWLLAGREADGADYTGLSSCLVLKCLMSWRFGALRLMTVKDIWHCGIMRSTETMNGEDISRRIIISLRVLACLVRSEKVPFHLSCS